MGIIKCSIDLLITEYKKVIAMIVLLALVILLVMSTIMIKVTSNYAYEEIDAVLVNGVDKAAKIEADEIIFDNSSIVAQINQLDGVECFGTMVSYSVYEECFSEFENIQIAYGNREADEFGTEMLFMNPSLFKLCDLKLDCGLDYEKIEKKSDKKFLYLGYDYYSMLPYEIGDSFDDSLGNHYEIAGIFEENQRIIDEKLINQFSVGEMSYSNDLNKMIICVDDSVLSTGFWLGAEEKGEIDSVIKSVRKELANEGYQTRFMTFKEMIDKGMSDSNMLYDIINKIAIMVSFAAILMVICIGIVIFISEIKRFGIMYSIGFNFEDIKNT